MKATIDVPDDLYRNWVQEPAVPAGDRMEQTKSWVDQLLEHAVPADLPGSTAREILEQDRSRLGLR
jgi:hypothetical protein